MSTKNVYWRRYLVLGLAVAVLTAGCASSPQATETALPATAAPEPSGLYCIHQSGRNNLCYADDSIAEDAVLLDKAVRTFCSQSAQYWCYIYVWKDEENVADALPLTDAESVTLLAKFISNPNTGQECLQVFDQGEVVRRLGFCD